MWETSGNTAIGASIPGVSRPTPNTLNPKGSKYANSAGGGGGVRYGDLLCRGGTGTTTREPSKPRQPLPPEPEQLL